MRHLYDEITSCFCENDKVLVALSGGADSVCLLHMLKNSKMNLDIFACHVNHNLRGEESVSDLRFVEALCQDMGIKLFVKEADICTLAKKQKLSIEECARKVRYDFFAQVADDIGAKIATAHTLSDNCETVLLNLLRGSGGKGLCGIPKTRENIVRPILSLTRDDVINYCSKHELKFVTDSTNAMTIYTRNKIRHDVIPILKEINPSFEANMDSFIKIMEQEQDYISTKAAKLYDSAKSDDKLNICKISNVHSALKAKIAMMFLHEHKLEVNAVNVNMFVSLINKKADKFNIKGDIFVTRVGDDICLKKRIEPVEYYEYPLVEGNFESKIGKLYKISIAKSKINQKFYISTKNVYDFLIDCDKICGNSIIRQRLPGDSIKIAGKNHTKSLKKLYNEAKIDTSLREKLFVIADENGAIAIENFGVATRVACDEHTKRFISIKTVDKVEKF